MATSNNALISVQQLTKEFRRGVVALDHCDLKVYRGEVVAIIGPSGSGKSTLLRSLNLLEQPTSGAIYFDGADLADKSVNIDLHRQKMGMVFQHFSNELRTISTAAGQSHKNTTGGRLAGVDAQLHPLRGHAGFQ